jgi:hypothetical protein
MHDLTDALREPPDTATTLFKTEHEEEASMRVKRGAVVEDFITALLISRDAYERLDKVNKSANFDSATEAEGITAYRQCMAALATAAVEAEQSHADFLKRHRARRCERGVIDPIGAISTALSAARGAVAGYQGDLGPKEPLLKPYRISDPKSSQVSSPELQLSTRGVANEMA